MVTTRRRDSASEATPLLLPNAVSGSSHLFSGNPLENKD
jgi:hypothetical protein